MGETMNQNTIIELKDVSYKYPDGTLALNNLSLKIEKGEKIAILGENGAGKSTMFLILNGVYKALSGKILFKNKEISYNPNDLLKLRKNIGIVFQDPETQIFSASVYEEISFGLMNLGIHKEEIKKRIDKILNLLDINHLKNKPTHLLSYGEKKRISIADILVMEPEIILFDEPTSCLDPKKTNEFIYILNEISKTGKTVLLSTHDVEFAYSFADYIVVMKNGEILKSGNPLEIFQDIELLKISNLEKPLILQIYEKLKELNIISEQDIIPRNKKDLFKHIKISK